MITKTPTNSHLLKAQRHDHGGAKPSGAGKKKPFTSAFLREHRQKPRMVLQKLDGLLHCRNCRRCPRQVGDVLDEEVDAVSSAIETGDPKTENGNRTARTNKKRRMQSTEEK